MGKKKIAKKSAKGSKVALGLAAGALAVGSVLWVTFGNGSSFPVPADRAAEVLDGDTFYAQNHVRMRLADLDAPELGKCGADESTKRLKELILNKPIYIKTKGSDQFHRNQVLVYTDKGLVNLKLIEEGLAAFHTDHNSVAEFKAASDKARKAKRGIFGPKCVQMTNKKNPSCKIKGNISDENSREVKYYYPPSCVIYDRTIVELYKGDRWFCTKKQALEAGFKMGPGCPK